MFLLVSPSVTAIEPNSGTVDGETGSLVMDRIERERAVLDNRSVLIAHKRNYILQKEKRGWRD